MEIWTGWLMGIGRLYLGLFALARSVAGRRRRSKLAA
jgi:hypothetical protein